MQKELCIRTYRRYRAVGLRWCGRCDYFRWVPMQISAFEILPGLSITLIEENGQWRFNDWSYRGHDVPRPPSSELERRFPNRDQAAEFFRTIFPALQEPEH